MVGCSTEKNTAQTRWWRSFNARYNTYFNGSMAYIDGSLEKENGNKDNYTEIIPLYTVGNKASRELGAANYDRAIEKCQKAIKRNSIKRKPEWTKSRKKTERDIEWLNRKEYNPFLWKAWLLMGRSQFMKGSFDEAASTFAYMARLYSTQPAIYGKARAWLAKCYVEQDWLYDAEDVITKIKRDSIHWRAQKEWDYTLADYYIHKGDFRTGIPYLRKVIKHEMRRKQRAREWFLMGQLQAAVGNRQEAYKAFRRVIRQNPPYELEFNARIAMTEVMAEGNSRQMIKRLRRMAASDNNSEYLDQVYYAIGNIYLAQKDTVNAIAAYEKGNKESVRNGIEKGVLLLHLGDIYWAKEKFSDARRCYGEAIGLLDKERDDYEQLSKRSVILDELVPYTDAIHLQDSLQALAKMPEKERNEAIDRVIEALKQKEKEERDALAESEAEQMVAAGSAVGRNQQTTAQRPTVAGNQSGLWYFYNQMAVNQGKSAFQKIWGKRENVDDWQRVNKTVVASAEGVEELTDEMRDSIAAVEAVQDSLEQVMDSAVNDPHKREYYLAQIPFTPEQVAESDNIIKDGLYNSGIIFKDKLDNLHLSEKNLRRLCDNYTDFQDMDDVYYHLFLLYSRKGMEATAQTYLDSLKAVYPESEWTVLLSDPYYEENARFGEHIEDSLYAATYEAFKNDRFAEVRSNTDVSEQRFPLGYHRDKFVFIGGLSKLNNGDAAGCVEDMNTVVEKYPQSDVSSMAGMIINGVKAGRRLHGGKFDMGSVWERRADVLSDSDSIAVRQFLPERDVDYTFMLAYLPDSVNENQLLFELARFNFTSFMVRNFDIVIDQTDELNRMMVKGFRSYDEVLQYARQLYSVGKVAELAQKCRSIIISDKNLELLGTQYSYNDYDEFYEKHFIPLRVSTVKLLTEPETIEYEKQPEVEKLEEDELYNGGVIDDDTYINLGVEDVDADNSSIEVPAEQGDDAVQEMDLQQTEQAQPQTEEAQPQGEDNGLVLPEDADESKNDAETDNGIVLPAEQQVPADVQKADEGALVVPETVTETKDNEVGKAAESAVNDAVMESKKAADDKPVEKKQEQKKPVVKPVEQEDTGIDFSDGFGSELQQESNSKAKQPAETQEFNLEDEYYELDGF